MQPHRKIASNLLWTPWGVVRRPLLELSADGRIVSADRCDDPDRSAATEFYAGLLVAGFPDDWLSAFEALRRRPEPLDTLLEEATRAAYASSFCPGPAADICLPAAAAPLVLLSGLDYTALRLTDRSEIRRIG